MVLVGGINSSVVTYFGLMMGLSTVTLNQRLGAMREARVLGGMGWVTILASAETSTWRAERRKTRGALLGLGRRIIGPRMPKNRAVRMGSD